MALTVLFRTAGFLKPAFLTLPPRSPRKFSLHLQSAAFRSGLFVAYTSVCVGQVFTAGPSSARHGLIGEPALLATTTALSTLHLCSVGTPVYAVRACALTI